MFLCFEARHYPSGGGGRLGPYENRPSKIRAKTFLIGSFDASRRVLELTTSQPVYQWSAQG